MKKNVNCKIVQDLLPNYIEGLTNEETNEYIENHLKECSECKEILKEMGEEIILDKIDEKIKIDYLKKIKNRNKTIITIIVVIAIAIITTMIVFFNSIGGVALDENGNPQYYEAFIKWITGESKIKTSRVTNIILKNKDDKVKATIVMTFDENDICIGARYCVEEETEEKLMDATRPFIVELYNEDSIMCLLKSIPVKQIADKFDKETRYRKIEIKDNTLLDKYNVKELPSLLFFKKQKLVGKIEGYVEEQDKEEFLNKIEEISNKE